MERISNYDDWKLSSGDECINDDIDPYDLADIRAAERMEEEYEKQKGEVVA